MSETKLALIKHIISWLTLSEFKTLIMMRGVDSEDNNTMIVPLVVRPGAERL
jgi:hypothetical protein